MTDHAQPERGVRGVEGSGQVGPLDIHALYAAFYPTLCMFIRRRFGSGQPEPEDVVQTAFFQLADHAKRGVIDNPKGFLYRIACNLVIDHRRRDQVHARSMRDISTLGLDLGPADDDPIRVIEGRSSLAAVKAAIDALDPRRREVLVMHSLEGISCAEIGRRMKVSPTRVIQLYSEAIAACAKALREEQ